MTIEERAREIEKELGRHRGFSLMGDWMRCSCGYRTLPLCNETDNAHIALAIARLWEAHDD